MEPVTMRINDLREQDKYFIEAEPSLFKRVFVMAADIRKRIDLERKREEEEKEEKRRGTLDTKRSLARYR